MKTLVTLFNRASPERAWFWSRFARASDVIVMTWGPSWSRRSVLGRPVGAWLLAVLWLGIPVVVVIAFR